MLCITLDEIKAQLRIPPADTSRDAELTRLGNSAEQWVAKYLNVTDPRGLVGDPASLLDMFGLSGQSPPALPEDMKSAMLLHVEIEFDRSPADATFLLQSAQRLLDAYRLDGIGV